MKIGNFLSKNERAKIKPIQGTIKSEMIDYTTEGLKSDLRANGGAIRAFLAAVLLCVFVGGCRTIQYIPIETGTTVNVRDSIRWEIKDSVRITEKSVYKDYTGLLDTLSIESGNAKMTAWADTSKNIINGTLENKPQEEHYKVIYKDRWKVRDSLVFKEIPVEIEKPVRYTPRWVWWSLAFNILTILGIGLIIYLKIKKPIG